LADRFIIGIAPSTKSSSSPHTLQNPSRGMHPAIWSDEVEQAADTDRVLPDFNGNSFEALYNEYIH